MVAAILLVAIMPLVWPVTPPLTDLPNHMSRYRISLDPALFARWFEFHWTLVGNLGVDLLVVPLAWIFGIELAVKLAMMVVILANVGGMLLVAHEAHGRIPATAAFALPFAYSYAFNFGFVNFVFSMGLALLAFGLWLRMGRLGQARRRAVLFVPIACLVWLTHVCGWVTLGMLVFASETIRARDSGRNWIAAAFLAGLACVPLALPFLGMLHWLGTDPSARRAENMFQPWSKLFYIFLAVRDGHAFFDVGSVAVVFGVLAFAVHHRAIGFDRRLLACAVLMGVAYLVMPGTLMGSYYADMRMAGYVLILALLAIRPAPGTRVARWLGIAALLFFAARMTMQTATYIALDREYQRQLGALDALPRGVRVFASVRAACFQDWDDPRMYHIARLAIVRRDAFVNGSWPPPGAQMLFARPEMTPGYVDQDSELLLPAKCRSNPRSSISGALAQIPRDHFDYYWLIGIKPAEWPRRPWLKPVWRGESGVLYKIVKPGAA
jgi:hypothetical protein